MRKLEKAKREIAKVSPGEVMTMGELSLPSLSFSRQGNCMVCSTHIRQPVSSDLRARANSPFRRRRTKVQWREITAKKSLRQQRSRVRAKTGHNVTKATTKANSSLFLWSQLMEAKGDDLLLLVPSSTEHAVRCCSASGIDRVVVVRMQLAVCIVRGTS